jgi:hypothetical protein
MPYEIKERVRLKPALTRFSKVSRKGKLSPKTMKRILDVLLGKTSLVSGDYQNMTFVRTHQAQSVLSGISPFSISDRRLFSLRPFHSVRKEWRFKPANEDFNNAEILQYHLASDHTDLYFSYKDQESALEIHRAEERLRKGIWKKVAQKF